MLNIYNENYGRIGLIEEYSYLGWTRRYSFCGDFEFKTTTKNIALLQIGNIICKVGDDEAGIIEYITAKPHQH